MTGCERQTYDARRALLARRVHLRLLQRGALAACSMNVAASAQRCVKIGRQTLRMDNSVLRGGSDAEELPHDELTDVEIMGCADADGRRDRRPVIGGGSAVRTCVHAFPQHGHSRWSQ